MGTSTLKLFHRRMKPKVSYLDEKIDAYMVVTTEQWQKYPENYLSEKLIRPSNTTVDPTAVDWFTVDDAGQSSLGISPEEVAALSQPAGFSRQKRSQF